MTTIVNAYGLAAKDAAHVSDVLFEIIKKGKTTGPELASSLGRVVSTAAVLGESIEEVGAALATLTKGGIDTNESVTALNQAYLLMLNPSKQAQKEAKRLGIELGAAAVRSKGFVGVLQDIQEKTRGNEEILASLTENVRALKAVLTLIGPLGKEYEQILEGMADVTGNTVVAFEKQSNTLGFQWEALVSNLHRVFIFTSEEASSLTEILKLLNKVIEDSTEGPKTMAEEYRELSESLKSARAEAEKFGDEIPALRTSIPVQTAPGMFTFQISDLGSESRDKVASAYQELEEFKNKMLFGSKEAIESFSHDSLERIKLLRKTSDETKREFEDYLNSRIEDTDSFKSLMEKLDDKRQHISQLTTLLSSPLSPGATEAFREQRSRALQEANDLKESLKALKSSEHDIDWDHLEKLRQDNLVASRVSKAAELDAGVNTSFFEGRGPTYSKLMDQTMGSVGGEGQRTGGLFRKILEYRKMLKNLSKEFFIEWQGLATEANRLSDLAMAGPEGEDAAAIQGQLDDLVQKFADFQQKVKDTAAASEELDEKAVGRKKLNPIIEAWKSMATAVQFYGEALEHLTAQNVPLETQLEFLSTHSQKLFKVLSEAGRLGEFRDQLIEQAQARHGEERGLQVGREQFVRLGQAAAFKEGTDAAKEYGKHMREVEDVLSSLTHYLPETAREMYNLELAKIRGADASKTMAEASKEAMEQVVEADQAAQKADEAREASNRTLKTFVHLNQEWVESTRDSLAQTVLQEGLVGNLAEGYKMATGILKDSNTELEKYKENQDKAAKGILTVTGQLEDGRQVFTETTKLMTLLGISSVKSIEDMIKALEDLKRARDENKLTDRQFQVGGLNIIGEMVQANPQGLLKEESREHLEELIKLVDSADLLVREKARKTFVTLAGAVKQIMGEVPPELQKVWDKIEWDSLEASQKISGVWKRQISTIVNDFGKSVANIIVDGVGNTKDGVRQIFKEIAKGALRVWLEEFFRPFAQEFAKLTTPIIRKLASLGRSLAQSIVGSLKKLFTGTAVGKGLTKAVSKIMDLFSKSLVAQIGLAVAAIGIGLYRLFTQSTTEAAVKEAARDFGVSIGEEAVKGFLEGIQIDEGEFSKIRKDVLSSPKFVETVLLPQARKHGTEELLIDEFRKVETAWGTFDLSAPLRHAIETGDFEAFNQAWFAVFGQSQALASQFGDKVLKVLGATDKALQKIIKTLSDLAERFRTTRVEIERVMLEWLKMTGRIGEGTAAANTTMFGPTQTPHGPGTSYPYVPPGTGPSGQQGTSYGGASGTSPYSTPDLRSPLFGRQSAGWADPYLWGGFGSYDEGGILDRAREGLGEGGMDYPPGYPGQPPGQPPVSPPTPPGPSGTTPTASGGITDQIRKDFGSDFVKWFGLLEQWIEGVGKARDATKLSVDELIAYQQELHNLGISLGVAEENMEAFVRGQTTGAQRVLGIKDSLAELIGDINGYRTALEDLKLSGSQTRMLVWDASGRVHTETPRENDGTGNGHPRLASGSVRVWNRLGAFGGHSRRGSLIV